MKFIRYFLLILIVAAQVAYLVHSYGERTKEIENAPRLVIKCNQYDPRDILRGDYFAIDNRFLRLQFDSPVWGKSLFWGEDLLPAINPNFSDKERYELGCAFAPREKAAEDAVDLKTLEGKLLAVFWKQGDDGIHTATRVEAVGTAEDTPAEGEIRTVMKLDLDYRFEYKTDFTSDERIIKELYASFRFQQTENGYIYSAIRFYIPDNMSPNCYEIPDGWLEKFTVELIYREDGTVIPHQLYAEGKPYLEAVQALPRKEGRSRYNTSLYGQDVEVAPGLVEVSEEEEAADEGEKTEEPSEEVKPEEPQSAEQTQPAEPTEEVQPQPEVQPPPAVEEPQPVVEEPQPAVEEPQPAVEEPQPAREPQPAEQPTAEPQPAPEPQPAAEPEPAPAEEEDDEI